MRTIEKTVYTIQELKDHFPAGYAAAWKKYRDNVMDDDFISGDIFASLKGLFDAIGIKLTNWSLGAYNRNNHIEFSLPVDMPEDFAGVRAYKWFINHLPEKAVYGNGQYLSSWRRKLCAYRYTYRDFNGKLQHDMRAGKALRHAHNATTGKLTFRDYNALGYVDECPFTGTCYDCDFLDYVKKELLSGATLRDALRGLAGEYARMLEAEIDYLCEEKQFIEDCDNNEFEFFENGETA